MEPQQHRLGSLYGTVLDNENMQPVDGAIVRALRNQISDTTDSLGAFRLDSLSIGMDSIRVRHTNHDTFHTTVNITGGEQEATFFLHHSARLPSHRLYVGDWNDDEVFVIDTKDNTVIDTLLGFDKTVWDLAVTKSGQKLYVSTREGPVNYPGKVYSVDIRTKQVQQIFAKVADVYAAPMGTVFIISKDPHQLPRPIGMIDTLSDGITFIDTLDIRDTGFNDQSVVFARNRPLMYAVTNENRLFSYDYQTRQIVKTYHLGYNPLHMVLSHDDRILYFTIVGDRLGVFDIENESLLTVVPANQLGSLASSPDGEYLYITDPGANLLPEPIPSGKVFIFHTSTNSYIGEIDVDEASGYAGTPTDRIVLTPDGRTAYVNNGANIFVIDLQSWEVTNLIRFVPRNLHLKPIVLGRKVP